MLTPAPAQTAAFTFRRFRGQADYAAMAEIARLCNLADRVPFIETVEDIANTYAHLVNSDPQHDVIMAEVDGELVGYQRTWWRRHSDGEYVYGITGHVTPAWRRQGLGRQLLERGERRLRHVAQAAQHPAGAPRYLQTFTSLNRAGKVALFEQAGYSVVRHFYEMERPLHDDLPPVSLPAGLALRPVQPEHLRAIWEANEEAFRDHWGHSAATEADYQGFLAQPHQDHRLWQVAWDTANNQVAGVAINIIDAAVNAEFNRQIAYVEDLSVRRAYRQRGLGRALLVASLHAFQARGLATAGLGVDAENPSGALGLYERVGFRQKEHSVAYRKAMALAEGTA
jgi:mycothiol synthase